MGYKSSRYTREDVAKALPEVRSYRALLKSLGMCPDGGGNTYTLRRKVKEWELDDSHFTGNAWLRGRTHEGKNGKPLASLMTENSSASRANLKRRLLREKLIENRCARCGSPPEWEGKLLALVLDHINGTRDDNRRENLRLLCPNCNSQEPSFAGRNKKAPTKE